MEEEGGRREKEEREGDQGGDVDAKTAPKVAQLGQ